MSDTVTEKTKTDYAKLLGLNAEDLTDLVWDPADAGIVVLNWGGTGVGKTRMGLEWPKPVFVFDCEGNTKETISQIPDKEGIFRYQFMPPSFRNLNAAKAEFDRFDKLYQGLLAECRAKGVQATFVLDSITLWYDMIRFALVPTDANTGKGQGTAWIYGPSNAAFKSIFANARYYRQRLYCTARSEQIWVNSSPVPGLYQAKVKEEALFEASIVLETQKTVVESPAGATTTRKYVVRKCNPNENLVGMSFPSLPYEQLVKLIQTM